MVLIAGSVNSEIAQIVKQGTSGVKFYIGRNIILFGYHIHHFYFGILLIAITGWIAITSPFTKPAEKSRENLAIIYGIGLGLLMDEIGLLLTWGHYYSSLSYLLSLFLLGIFLNIIFFPSFWQEFKKEITSSKSNIILNKFEYLIKLAENLSNISKKTEKATLIFTGTAYLIIGMLILIYPNFIYYLVGSLFLIQGISHLVRSWPGNKD